MLLAHQKWYCVYFLVCWKLPFYMLLLSVDLPETAIVIKRQVSYTDVYNPHILAEIVFVSDRGYGDIKETNRIIMGESHLMDWHIMNRWELMEWDDACISIKEMDELAARKGRGNWYYVSFNMPVPTLILLRVVAVVVIFVVMHIVLARKKKKEN